MKIEKLWAYYHTENDNKYWVSAHFTTSPICRCDCEYDAKWICDRLNLLADMKNILK